MVYEVMELILKADETSLTKEQLEESFFFYWYQHPKLSKIAMLCFLRSYKKQLMEQLCEIYESYEETNFCIRKLSTNDLEIIEKTFVEKFVKGGGKNVV